MINILVVEDEKRVASFLKKGLEENNFSVQVAHNGMDGRHLFYNQKFDLIILDINLPLMNGHDLLKVVRTVNAKIPVLMLTALGSMDDKIQGFETGADDYLVKPFEFVELLLRIKALLHRTGTLQQIGKVLKIADLEMNLESKTVKRNNRNIELTAKEFSLLEMFMKNQDKVLSRADIAEHIWDISFDTGTNMIDVYINFLRKKIDRDFNPKLIHTKYGMGYILKEEEM